MIFLPLVMFMVAGTQGVPAAPSPPRFSEWTVSAGIANSVDLFQSTAGRAYAVQTIGYSRELTGDLKFVGVPGRFAWGIEVMPVFAGEKRAAAE